MTGDGICRHDKQGIDRVNIFARLWFHLNVPIKAPIVASVKPKSFATLEKSCDEGRAGLHREGRGP